MNRETRSSPMPVMATSPEFHLLQNSLVSDLRIVTPIALYFSNNMILSWGNGVASMRIRDNASHTFQE